MLLLSACGPGGGGSSAPAETPPGPRVLQSLSVAASPVTLACGQIKTFTCMGHYSDGTSDLVPALWSTTTTAVTLSAGMTQVISTRVAWAEEGATVVKAETLGLGTEVQVNTAAASGFLMYGVNDHGEIYAYPPGGGTPVLQYNTPTTDLGGGYLAGSVVAITVDAAGENLYYIYHPGNAPEIHQLNTTTWVDKIAFKPTGPAKYQGLDRDSEGYLWTNNIMNGNLVRIDPVAGEKLDVTLSTPQYEGPFAVGPEDAKYMGAALAFGTPTFLYRQTPNGDGVDWGSDELLAYDETWYGYVQVVGIALNSSAECFVSGGNTPGVWRFRDANEDGDALDLADDECTLFSDVTGTGIAVAPDGTVLANVPGDGVYALKDLNGDGDALDAGEKTKVSTFAMTDSVTCGANLCVVRGW